MNNLRSTSAALRNIIDKADPFLTDGHQIKKIRTVKRTVPEWATDNEQIRKLLVRSFPKLATDVSQRQRAATWARVIHLFFKMGMTRGQVAEELNTSFSRIHGILKRIRRVSKGIRANNTGLLGNKTGRPRKP